MRLRKPETGGRSQAASQFRLVLDPCIVGPALTIFFFSLCALFSVVYHPIAFEIEPNLATDFTTPFVKHLVWGTMGLAGMTWFAFIDLEKVRARTRWIYFGGLVLLVAVLLFGIKVRNIRAWLSIGILTFQPSEIIKVVLVLAAARFLSLPEREERPLTSLAAVAILIGIPSALVLKQPDLGTVIVYLSLLLTLPFASGLPAQYLILILVSCLLAGLRLMTGMAVESLGVIPDGVVKTLVTDPHPALMLLVVMVVAGAAIAAAMSMARMRHAFTVFLYAVVPPASIYGSFLLTDHLKPYQKLRLLTFLAPQLDPKGSGYNILQSQIAFGSGGLLGKGFRGATQSTLGFLPERQTDFIFSVIGEVFGFFGVAIVVGAFVLLILRILWISAQARDRFGSLVCVGAATILLTHVLVNMGMAIGMMPIMGIPLPLASYGGTAMVTVFTLLGFVLAVERETRLL